jgi:hypothetical protein
MIYLKWWKNYEKPKIDEILGHYNNGPKTDVVTMKYIDKKFSY